MKLIVDSATDKGLGVCMVGPDAAEIMQVMFISIPVLVSLPVVLIVLSLCDANMWVRHQARKRMKGGC